jgi:hypothetical protein
MKKLIIPLVVVLSGCSTIERYSGAAIDQITAANDLELAAAELAYCDAPSNGALSRRYGGQADIQDLRNELCQLIRAKFYGVE